ncbi:MAG: hypothetical protein MJY88_01180 [Bacteroidales bacterium]|nr:hypothetical protein [Bacteroidales bacterium]
MNLIESIKDFMRRRALKKNASTVPTKIKALSLIRTAVTVIDVEDTSFDACKESILAFYREHKIKGEIFFFDFRKITSEERLITSITNTVLKKDINWYGRPSAEKMKYIDNLNPDMFISLIKGTDFPIEYMAKYCRASFKVGRTQLPGNVYDLVVSDPKSKDYSEAEVFEGIKKYIKVVTENN